VSERLADGSAAVGEIRDRPPCIASPGRPNKLPYLSAVLTLRSDRAGNAAHALLAGQPLSIHDYVAMDLVRQGLDRHTQILRYLRQARVLIHEFEELGGLLGGQVLSLSTGRGECLAMLGVSLDMSFVSIGLSRLGQEDQGCGVGRLQAEREVQQDERAASK